MDGILKLDDYNVKTNAALGSHDPSMMWDSLTKKYYSYSTDIYKPKFGLTEKIGIPVRVSEDLIHFEYKGTVLSKKSIEESRYNAALPPTPNFWAPFVEYINGSYRMYYSVTRAFGSSQSRIWLATAKNPLGPFENEGIVMDTWDTDNTYPNAIDAHIIWQNNIPWLVYGSFFGGIYIKELNPKTGLAKNGSKDFGICISKASANPILGGPEGASIIYIPETKYYYLFQSYGWLGDNYDIRVGRSKNLIGDYTDFNGKSLIEQSMGVKLAGSYKFEAPNYKCKQNKLWKWGGFRAPGHGVPFFDPKTKHYFFVHHIRDGAEIFSSYDKKSKRKSYSMHYLAIRPMYFINDWPVLSPEFYSGENPEPISPNNLNGVWEIITLDTLDQKSSIQINLNEFSKELANGIIHRAWDFENQGKTVCISGYLNSGIAYWGKLRYNNILL